MIFGYSGLSHNYPEASMDNSNNLQDELRKTMLSTTNLDNHFLSPNYKKYTMKAIAKKTWLFPSVENNAG